MKKLLLLSTLLLSFSLFGAGHNEKGTDYGKTGVDKYAKARHGADGALFLDPYFLPYLNDVKNETLLDAGCGTGVWGILAAKNGAKVYGIDIQETMIEKAKKGAIDEGVKDSTLFEVGDVSHLPYKDSFFDKAISINVGCNLPELEGHIKELKRVLKPSGIAVITAPTSFGVVFTDGKKINKDITSKINTLLKQKENFPGSIETLDEVYRATFTLTKQGKPVLVTDESTLKKGEKIWRKIPKLVVPNHYHSEKEYLNLLKKHGLAIKKLSHPKFNSYQDRMLYNSGHKETLGPEYEKDPPFVIFVVEKPTN